MFPRAIVSYIVMYVVSSLPIGGCKDKKAKKTEFRKRNPLSLWLTYIFLKRLNRKLYTPKKNNKNGKKKNCSVVSGDRYISLLLPVQPKDKSNNMDILG